MINKVLTTIFGSKHERDVKRMLPAVADINSLEPEVSRMSDDQLREKTAVIARHHGASSAPDRPGFF